MKTKFVAIGAMIVLIGVALLSPGIIAASEGEDVTDAYGDILQLQDRDRDRDQNGTCDGSQDRDRDQYQNGTCDRLQTQQMLRDGSCTQVQSQTMLMQMDCGENGDGNTAQTRTMARNGQ